jgi:hypothetical protein
MLTIERSTEELTNIFNTQRFNLTGKPVTHDEMKEIMKEISFFPMFSIHIDAKGNSAYGLSHHNKRFGWHPDNNSQTMKDKSVSQDIEIESISE